MEQIVAEQITMGELGYDGEDGSWVSGEGVIEDVILQGAEHNQKRHDLRTSLGNSPGDGEADGEWSAPHQEEFFPSEETDDDIAEAPDTAPAMAPYEHQGPLTAYANSATFAEDIWLREYW